MTQEYSENGNPSAPIPGLDVMYMLSLLLVLVLASRGLIFFRVLQFSSLLENKLFQIAIRSGEGPQLVLCAKYIDT